VTAAFATIMVVTTAVAYALRRQIDPFLRDEKGGERVVRLFVIVTLTLLLLRFAFLAGYSQMAFHRSFWHIWSKRFLLIGAVGAFTSLLYFVYSVWLLRIALPFQRETGPDPAGARDLVRNATILFLPFAVLSIAGSPFDEAVVSNEFLFMVREMTRRATGMAHLYWWTIATIIAVQRLRSAGVSLGWRHVAGFAMGATLLSAALVYRAFRPNDSEVDTWKFRFLDRRLLSVDVKDVAVGGTVPGWEREVDVVVYEAMSNDLRRVRFGIER
jgi:hypothetical protein